MPYSIPGSTKILIYILWQQHHFFILVGTLCVCEFAMVPGIDIKKKKVHSSTYTFSCTIIKKILTSACDCIIVTSSLLNWKKRQQKKYLLFIVLVI